MFCFTSHLSGDERSRLKQSQVSPHARLAEDAEELTLDGPETDGQLGWGGKEKSLVDGYHFHACYARDMTPTPHLAYQYYYTKCTVSNKTVPTYFLLRVCQLWTDFNVKQIMTL